LFAKGTQPPHDDDAAALAQLGRLAGDDSTGGFATNDARNYARMKLNTLPGAQPMEYSEARDGGGFMGSLGGVFKKLAPLAGLIPGIGVPLGAGIGAAGSALGGAMSGDDFDLGKTLFSGLAAHANPFGSKIPDAPNVSAMGSQGYTPTGTPYTPGAGAAFDATQKAQAAPGGFMSQLGNQFKDPTGKIDFTKLATIGGKGAEVLGARSQRRTQERLANSQLQLRTRQLGMAEDEYASREPLRKQALARLGNMKTGSSIFGGGY
jgi:hypothetical protein